MRKILEINDWCFGRFDRKLLLIVHKWYDMTIDGMCEWMSLLKGFAIRPWDHYFDRWYQIFLGFVWLQTSDGLRWEHFEHNSVYYFHNVMSFQCMFTLDTRTELNAIECYWMPALQRSAHQRISPSFGSDMRTMITTKTFSDYFKWHSDKR